jgi:cardiolipin synthase A/B
MENFWPVTSIIVEILLIITIIFVVFIVILENRNPVKTISWVLLIVFLPLIGIIFYFLLGRNYRKQKIFLKKSIKDFQNIDKYFAEQILNLKDKSNFYNEQIENKLGIIKLLINNNKALLTEHNRVTILNNGAATFESIIEEIKKAKNSIHLEYYIIEEDTIGNTIKDLLIQKAKEGLKVRIIYDDVGSWDLSDEFIEDLEKNGIEAYSFMPVRFQKLTTRINFRNHRKIIVIDGIVGFTGGINIADRYVQGLKDIGIWRDTHLKIEGDAVKSLQVVFLIDWFFVSNQFINSEIYFPDQQINNKCFIQIASSGPDSDWESIMQAFFYAISTAKKYVYISTPYFIPNESILTALKTVALSGVDIRIILPLKSDSKLSYWSSLSYIEELLEAGIKVYMFKKGFTHSKLLIIDDIFCSVGTANMDIRSFDQNFEISALIYDEEVTNALKNSYIDDLNNCQQITLDEFLERPFKHRFYESFARVFSPLL